MTSQGKKRKGGLAGANLCNMPQAEPARPIPKHTVETRYVVDYHDFEEYIESVTGHRINIPAIELTGNDTTLDMEVVDMGEDEEFDEDEQEEYNTFLKTGKVEEYSLHVILDGLCQQGKLLPGTYLISICW